jgi:hypothetical protein
MEKDTTEKIARLRGGQPEDEPDQGQEQKPAGGTDLGSAPAPPSSSAESGPDGQPIGADNIRDGTVRGLMGGPNQTQGEGQGG